MYLRKALLASVCLTVLLAACGGGEPPSLDQGSLVSTADVSLKSVDSVMPVYRFAKISNGAYFYTGDSYERDVVITSYPDFRYEGVAFLRASGSTTKPVYRFANLINGGYFYTADANERDVVLSSYPQFRYEGVWFSVALDSAPDTVPVWRLANLVNGAYLYTSDANERQVAIASGVWRDEGVAYRAPTYATVDALPPTPSRVSAGPGCSLNYTITGSPILTGTDPSLGAQWHLRNTGQLGGRPGEDIRALDTWPITRGAGVRVAVIDDAIEVVHPDLLPNLVEGASRSYRPGNRGSPWPLPCSASGDDHGTAVAGLVLARDGNAVGGAGVAPRASLVAFDALSGGQDADIADALLRDQDRNAIYQNSWGSPDDGRLHTPPASFVSAIQTGVATGRGGLGSIFVFSAGNGGCFAIDGSGACQNDNSNYDGFVNRFGVVTVCAVDRNGRRPYYAEPGANLLVCGPSSGDSPDVVATGVQSTMRGDFSGTSAATPMVSGAIALMLAANPALTWRDVRLILAQSARRVDTSNPSWSIGPGGYWFSHVYGFGVVDAAAAVSLARSWTSVGGSSRLKSCVVAPRTPNLDVPDLPSSGVPQPVADAAGIAGCGISRIEAIEVQFTATHTYSGDLRIRLTSPSGTISELADARLCVASGSNPCGDYADWTFSSMRHLGEAADGIWTLQVADLQPLDTGRFVRWSLRIHGR